MRGLKPGVESEIKGGWVASFTDAWIETSVHGTSCVGRVVASFTDAWIETLVSPVFLHKGNVASFTDAWIETESVTLK